MVCVPCFIIPVLLFIWHKFIQPYVLRFWNPWRVKEDDNKTTVSSDFSGIQFPFHCVDGVCTFSMKKPKVKEVGSNLCGDNEVISPDLDLKDSGDKELMELRQKVE